MGFLPATRSTAYSTSVSRLESPFPGNLRRWGWLGVALLVLVGLGFSLFLAAQPFYAAGLVIAAGGLFVFLRNFEQAVLGILMLRSVLDMYSAQGIPAVFAIGVDLLVFLYLGRQLIFRQRVHTDPFWWFLFGWVLLQSIWVVLLAADGLGGTQFMAYEGAREWTRLFSLAMVYLLVMQLRDRISPDRLATLLFWSAALPIGLAMLQALPIELPDFLQSNVAWTEYESESARINSTLGHYNSFATFSLLFLALSLWRIQISRKPLGWMLLAAGLLYCLMLSRSLTGIVMLVVFAVAYFVPKLRGRGLVGAVMVALALVFLLSTDLAQSRLLELNQTPLLNPEISVSRAIALQSADMDEFRNSFNWRLVQWRNLLIDWQEHPLMGYGLASAKELSVFNTTAHNDYIRFLVEEGIVGLSLFLLFLMAQMARLIQIMRQSLPQSPQRALSQTMFAFMIAMVVGMAAGNVMVHTATFFYWWTLMALLGWSWPARIDESTEGIKERALELSAITPEQSDGYATNSVRISTNQSGFEDTTLDFHTDNTLYGDVDRYNYADSFMIKMTDNRHDVSSYTYDENRNNTRNSLASSYMSNDDFLIENDTFENTSVSSAVNSSDTESSHTESFDKHNQSAHDLYVYRPRDTYLSGRYSDSDFPLDND